MRTSILLLSSVLLVSLTNLQYVSGAQSKSDTYVVYTDNEARWADINELKDLAVKGVVHASKNTKSIVYKKISEKNTEYTDGRNSNGCISLPLIPSQMDAVLVEGQRDYRVRGYKTLVGIEGTVWVTIQCEVQTSGSALYEPLSFKVHAKKITPMIIREGDEDAVALEKTKEEVTSIEPVTF